jgi:phage/plasmid primase-like uncharacterized protein
MYMHNIANLRARINPQDARTEFTAAMRGRGLALSQDGLIADGEFHRCNVASKGRNGVNDGSYVLHLSPVPHGAFTNWTDGRGFTRWRFKTSRKALTAEEEREIERAMAKARTTYAKERATLRAEARVKAKNMWADAEEASDHEYCGRKEVEPYGLRTIRFKDGDQPLLVPMRDAKGKLVNLQFIHTNGDKHGLKGGPQKDCHYWVAMPEGTKSNTIVVCEGWATGESIFQATGHAVLVAFNAGNLLSVAKWVRERYPEHRIVIAADDDWKKKGNPGLTKATEAARAVNGSVAIPVFGGDRGDKDTDFNDMFVADGLDAVQHTIDDARDPDQLDESEEEEEGDDAQHNAKQADVLIGLALSEAELFHSDVDGYADISVNDHRETQRIGSKGFRKWLLRLYFVTMQSTPTGDAMRRAIETIDAKAQFDGPMRAVHIRVGGHDGKLYIDLADDAWRAVEIDAEGWRIVDEPPVRFRRAKGMLALPEPVRDGSIEELRAFLNVKRDADFVLVVSWLLAALRDRGPYPILKVWGEPGSAKSTLVEMLRALVDPNKASRRRFPREDRDLFIAANNALVLSYDNVSHVPVWLSNSLCTLSTGGSYATRTLYTDQDEELFEAMRPVILNGIENFVTKHDLADRIIVLELQQIPDHERRLEKEFKAEFEAARPRILGALFDIIAHGMRMLPETQEESWPRMADFAQWATACETAVWSAGTFGKAYAGNRKRATMGAIDDDPVATALRAFVDAAHPEWVGTTSELLYVLTKYIGEKQAKSKDWPIEPRALTGHLQRAKASLRRVGIEIRRGKRTSRGSMLTITYAMQTSAKNTHNTHNRHLALVSNWMDDDGRYVGPLSDRLDTHRSHKIDTHTDAHTTRTRYSLEK